MKQKETIRSLWTPTAGMLTGARRAAMLLLTTLLLTLTAQTAWAEEEGHNIIYELYGGTNSRDNPETYNSEAGVSSLSDPTPPEKSGYTFGGWYRDPEFSTPVSDTAIPSGSTGDFKFYAKWLKSITVHVIWDDNNNLDGKRPSEVFVKLSTNQGTDVGTKTVSLENYWTAIFENMPVHHLGKEIIYTISFETDNMPLDDLYKYSIEGTDITFTRKTGDLTVTNTVTNRLEYLNDKEFTFTVTLEPKISGAFIVTLEPKISGTFDVLKFVDGIATFTLKNGQSLTASHLPTSLGYTVTVDHEEGFTSEESTITGTVATGSSTAVFAHTYSAVGRSVTLEAKANVENQYLQNKIFSFNLLDANNNVIQNVEQNNETGIATFAPINYTLDDLDGNKSKDFVYTIEQVIPEGAKTINGWPAYNGVAYDNRLNQLIVTVTDNGDGTLGVSDFTIPEWDNKVVATVTADDLSKVYGENDPELTAKVKVGDIIIKEGIDYSLSRQEGDDVGNYVITPVVDPIQDDYTVGNYLVTTVNGTLTIDKAPLTVTANDRSIFYGNAAANDGVTYNGFVNGETESVLEGTLTYTYSNDNRPYGEGNDAPGEYDITPGGLTSNNYAITFVPGKLTVNPVTVKVSVVDKGNGQPIVGNLVVVRNSNGVIIHEWPSTSTEENHEISVLKAGGEYTIMGNAYMGYTRSADYTLTIDENGNVSSYSGTTTEDGVLLVESGQTHVEFSVVDMVDGDKLAGATVQVIDSEGKVVEEWVSVSETENHIIEGFTIFEEYTLCETVAPNGYAAPVACTFTIDETGKVTTTGGTTTTDEEGNTVLVLKIPFTVPLFAANSSNLWMTWCDKYDYVKPEGVTVYTVSSVENNTVTLEEVSVIPAYTPVLLYRKAAGVDAVTATFSAVGTAPASDYDSSSGIVEANLSDNVTLYGNSGDEAYASGNSNNIYAISDLSDTQSYVLRNGNFVAVDKDGGIGAHRCWLNVTKSTTNGARLLSINTGGENTGIETTNFTTPTNSSGAWYGLDGRKLDKQPTKKGLYIYNGKKHVIK